jgi:hypothetical protein
MSTDSIYLYTVGHSHCEGDNAFMVCSASPDLDVLDLMVSDPDQYEPHRADESVTIKQVPPAIQIAIDEASAPARQRIAQSLPRIDKAPREKRSAILSSLNEDALVSAGLWMTSMSEVTYH